MPKKYNPYNKTFFSWFKDRSYLHFDKPLTKPVLRREKDGHQLQKGVLKKNKSILKKIFNSYIDADISTNQNNYSKKLQSINFFRLFNAKLKFGKHIHYLRISPLFVIKKKSDILHTHRI